MIMELNNSIVLLLITFLLVKPGNWGNRNTTFSSITILTEMEIF